MLTEYIKEKIERGEYSPGCTIKTEREYAQEFGLTQSKVHRELQKLVDDGYIESKRGSGYKVVQKEIKRAIWRVAFLSPLSDLHSGLGEEGTTFIMKAQAANIKIDLFLHENENNAVFIENIMDKIITEKECSAVIINPTTEHADYRKAALMAYKSRIPLIWRDFNPVSFLLPGAGPNHSVIGAVAAKTLFSKGYRKTLFLGHARIVGNRTYDAFTLMSDDIGLEYERLDYTKDDFISSLSSRLKKADFDSVFACTSHLSNVAYSCILNAGIEMPQGVGFLANRRTIFDSGHSIRKVDALVLDNELYADKLVSLLKSAMKYPDAMETQIFTMLPKYISGTTLR